MRPRVSFAAFAWPLAALLGLSFGLASLSGLAVAHAAEPEPILFLGIQRGNNIDRVGTDLVREYLVDRGEQVLRTVQLGEADRRCRRQQCLSELAQAKQAVLVLSGDVSTTGPTRNLRVQLRLFDQRRRGTPDALAEIENLCLDCDETKLGIMLTGSTSELLAQYRQFAGTAAPTPPSQSASPAQAAGSSPTQAPAASPAPATDAAWPAWQPRPGPAASAPAQTAPSPYGPPAAPAPGAMQAPPATSYVTPPTQAPVPYAPTAPAPYVAVPNPYSIPQGSVAPPAAPSYPTQAAQIPVESGLPTQRAPQPMPPQQQPYLQAQARTQPQIPTPAATQPKTKKPLSPVRKGVAAVFGVLGFGSLITAAVMHGLDRRLAPDLSVNPMGTACMMPENAGRSCVLSTVGVYAPTYAVGALLVGGMILTLTIPESKPRPLSEPLIP